MQSPVGHELESAAPEAEAASAHRKGPPAAKGSTVADPPPPRPTIADLWALCDAACHRTNRTLHRRGQPAIIMRQTPRERRYFATGSGEGPRFIAIVPLLPTLRGGVSCGAYIGTRAYCQYVEPVARRVRWRVASSGAPFDRSAMHALFAGVFGGRTTEDHTPRG
jgi:hypothetical protein